MTDEDHASSGDDDVDLEVSSSEKAAMDRKRRLLAMKSKIHGIEMKAEDYEEPESATKRSKTGERAFRNYVPNAGEPVAKIDEKNFEFDAVEKEIAQHIEDTKNTELPTQIDASSLQPKKIDWDLKRNLEKRLAKLDRQTQKSVAAIIRARLQETGDLAAAVHASSRAEEA